MPIINLVRSGFGTWSEILTLKEKHGMDYLLDIQYILSILQQEDELDARNNHRGY